MHYLLLTFKCAFIGVVGFFVLQIFVEVLIGAASGISQEIGRKLRRRAYLKNIQRIEKAKVSRSF